MPCSFFRVSCPTLRVSVPGGQLDQEPSINIRGTTSINGGSPLIIVDGVPTDVGDFGRLNTQDIDNISVLKDASAAAIYGARAAFGVVLVTTKKGGSEKLRINFNNNFNIKTLTNRPDYVKDTYLQAYYKKIMGAPWYDRYSDQELEYAAKIDGDPTLPRIVPKDRNPSEYQYYEWHDWFDEMYDKTGFSHQHNISLSGSTDKVSYFTSAEYYGEAGLLRHNKDHYNRYNIRNNIEYRPLSWLTLGNNTSFTYYKYTRPTAYTGDMMYFIYNDANILMPVYNPDGTYTQNGARVVGALEKGGDLTDKYSTLFTQFNVQADIIKNIWTVKADFSATIKEYRSESWQSDRNITYRTGPVESDHTLGWKNWASMSTSKTIHTTVNVYTDFHKDFGQHSLSAMAGFSQEYDDWSKYNAWREGLISDSYPTPQLADGESTIEHLETDYSLRSFFYRLNYTFGNRYIIETNGRYDGVSKFPKNNRFGFFPSVSAAWIFTNESFLKQLNPILSYGKLRASYGSLGNQSVGAYAYISSMGSSKLNNLLLNGSFPMTVYAPGLVSGNLTCEKVYTKNIGLDLNFFNNRLSTSVDFYRRDTKDMLTKGRTLPGVLGTTEPKINAADLKTEGWELSVMWRDQFSLAEKPFSYSARFIISDSRSWITKFDNPTGNLSDYYEGMEFGEIWGLVTDGFFKDQADIDNSADQKVVTSYPGDRKIQPGDLKFVDLNGDGKIDWGAWTKDDPGDSKVIGNSSPRYQYALDLNATWNGFDIRAFFQGIGKRDYYPTNGSSWGRFWGPYWNPNSSVTYELLDCWSEENPDAYFPRPKSYIAFVEWCDAACAQTRYLQNASYLRLKNLTIGYSLPKSILNKISLSQLRVYLSADNLCEFTKLSKSYDPETLGGNIHPLYRTYTVGLNISF